VFLSLQSSDDWRFDVTGFILDKQVAADSPVVDKLAVVGGSPVVVDKQVAVVDSPVAVDKQVVVVDSPVAVDKPAAVEDSLAAVEDKPVVVERHKVWLGVVCYRLLFF
jgi:hypothetical protein